MCLSAGLIGVHAVELTNLVNGHIIIRLEVTEENLKTTTGPEMMSSRSTLAAEPCTVVHVVLECFVVNYLMLIMLHRGSVWR